MSWDSRVLAQVARRSEPGREPEPGLRLWDAGADDYTTIPPRGWLLGNTFCRRFLSSLIADGGVGKTALRLAQLVSLAIGRSLTDEHVFCRCRVLIVSFEDDRDELRRRVLAVLRHHHVHPEDLSGWLFLAAPKGLRLAEMGLDGPQAGELDAMLRGEIEARKIDVVSLDPFVKTHGLEENSNNAVDYVCGLLAAIAIDLNCAVDLPHHTSKGIAATAGDANRGRGATAMKDAARLVFTLTPMTTDEAEAFGVHEADRRFLVRLDSAKVNIAPPSREAKWFRLVGVPLANATPEYPHGDEVQTVEPWTPPPAKIASLTDLAALATAIGQGSPGGEPWSDKLDKNPRSVSALLAERGFADPKAKKATLDRLMTEFGVERGRYLRPDRNKAWGLHVGGKPAANWLSDE